MCVFCRAPAYNLDFILLVKLIRTSTVQNKNKVTRVNTLNLSRSPRISGVGAVVLPKRAVGSTLAFMPPEFRICGHYLFEVFGASAPTLPCSAKQGRVSLVLFAFLSSVFSLLQTPMAEAIWTVWSMVQCSIWVEGVIKMRSLM